MKMHPMVKIAVIGAVTAVAINYFLQPTLNKAL